VGIREGAAESMNYRRDFARWPNACLDDASRSVSSSEMRKDAVLKNVRRLGNELTLMVEPNGGICTAQIGSQLFEDSLILLPHIRLQHEVEPISAAEDLEVNRTVLA
jgi:hypothetical protein